MVEVRNRSTNALIAAYRYNGLGHRIGFHYDVDADGTVESTADDPWTYYAYDERWRLLATFTGANTAPTEEWVHHNAGLGGRGGSSDSCSQRTPVSGICRRHEPG